MNERLGNGLGDANGVSLDYNSIPTYMSIPFEISTEERRILRELAQKLHELANRPEQEEKKELWYRHNNLEETRPLIVCDPENGWYEIIPASSLQCKNSLARMWEFRIKKELYWGEVLKDDKVIEDLFNVHYMFLYSDFGVENQMEMPDDCNGAYTWKAAIQDYEKDLPLLRVRDIDIDYDKTSQLYNLAQNTFGDIIPIKLKGAFWWSFGMTADLVYLRGMENMMIDMYEHPKELHRVMEVLHQDAMNRIDFFESHNLLTPNNRGEYIASGGFGWNRDMLDGDFDGRVMAKDMWGFCESQETLGISAEMFEEFIFPYQQPIMERFGLSCYGCCEPVNQRWHVISKAKNLRRVSVSAWADRKAMAEMLNQKYIYSWKPTPSDLAMPQIDTEHIRTYIKETMNITRSNRCRLEIIMKDNHTLGNNPQNVIDWVRIAREVTEE